MKKAIEMTQTTTVSNDITTRLLAQENLLIERAPVRTASFDVKHRILTLPQWQNMTTEIEEMLKAHEVGHALYTDMSMFAKFRESNVPFSYYNIIEDVRIERLMKLKYPGLRRTFTQAYKELLAMDFFGTMTKDTKTLSFADRINLYFKAGYECGVTFTAAEKFLLDQVSRVDTIDDVDVLARKVYEFSKKQAKEKAVRFMEDEGLKKLFVETVGEQEEEDEFDQYDELDPHDSADDDFGDDVKPEESDDDEDAKSGAGRSGGASTKDVTYDEDSEIEKQLAATTNSSFEDKIAELADTDTKYTYIDLPNFGKFADQFVIPYKKVLADNDNALEALQTHYINRGYENAAENLGVKFVTAESEYEKFQFETSKVVSYLVKEFEMKKAATDYKRTHVAKTGVLDPRKLASFKIREDLFKQITITKDGQKHGMIFVLDWSGSMNDYLPETVKQLISLVQFCYRTKIPFQVFAFSDNQELIYDEMGTLEKNRLMTEKIYNRGQGNLVNGSTRFSMIEFFNHKMKISELNRMCKTLFSMAHGITHPAYSTNGTPLNEALIFMYDYIGEFMRNNQVEKFTMIKLTDGDGGRCSSFVDTETSEHNYMNERSYDPTTGKWTKCVLFLRDKATKKNYTIETNETIWGNMLTQMIRDRYNCGTIGFHVAKSGGRDVAMALNTYGATLSSVDVVTVKRDMIKDQFAALTVYGHDELFLLRANMKISDEQLKEDMTNMSAAAIAKNFSKHLSAKKTSRVLLNRFVKVVA